MLTRREDTYPYAGCSVQQRWCTRKSYHSIACMAAAHPPIQLVCMHEQASYMRPYNTIGARMWSRGPAA